MLACEFRLTVDCQRVLTHLDRLLPHAIQHYPVSRRHHLHVRGAPGGYRVGAGDGTDFHRTPRAAAQNVLMRIHDLSLAALPEFTRIHAGCASRDGKRLLAVGPARAGKSTLMSALLYEGFAVHCDDIVLLRAGEVLPYPRRFLIRSSTVALLPALAAVPAQPDDDDGGDGDGELALDPSELGFEWRIEPGPVDAVFFLRPDPDRPSRVEPCPKYEMAALVMAHTNLPRGGRGPWVRDICAMLNRARCYTLRWQELEASLRAVTGAF